MGGVFTSPYGISVDGTTVPLICDDFTTDISFGQTWSAIPTTFAALETGAPAGTPKFGPGGTADPAITTFDEEIQSYATVAVLAAELLALPDDVSHAEPLGELSYALWDVFDPGLLSSVDNPFGSISPLELSAAQGYLAAAQALVAGATTGSGAGLRVDLSQISINGNAIEGMTLYTPSPTGAAQEFVTVSVPEAPPLAESAVYLLLGGGSLLLL